jgi:hypothetical protein
MKKALAYIFVLALALALCACSSAPQVSGSPAPSFAAGTASAAPAGQSPGAAASSSAPAVAVAQVAGWPDDIPAYVPAFDAGTFVQEDSSRVDIGGAVTYGMAFAGVSRQDIDAYLAALKQAGFEAYPNETEGVYAVAGTVTKSGGASVMVSASLEDATGNCSLIVILTPLKG